MSKGVYRFGNDVAFSEHYEEQIINRINRSGVYTASKSHLKGYPDIEIRQGADVIRYIEVKVQQRTFMTIRDVLPHSDLTPSETLALNESDLLRYFSIRKETAIPVSVVWVVLNRLCMVPHNKVLLYSQSVEELEKIYNSYKDKRRFRRRSGEGDVVDGVHKGVVVNYHFSMKELREWK